MQKIAISLMIIAMLFIPSQVLNLRCSRRKTLQLRYPFYRSARLTRYCSQKMILGHKVS